MKYVTPQPLPTPHEREMLTIFAEECCEVAVRVSKLLRFGKDEVQPGQSLSNMERLSREYGQLVEMGTRLRVLGLLSNEHAMLGREEKRDSLPKYMQTEAPA